MTNRCVLYSRVSTDAQERVGTSLETQERACLEHAEAMGWRVVEVIRDTASGYTLDRPGMERIRSQVRDGQVDVVAGDATSALIDALHLTALEDSRHYFPPYDAVPVVRTSSLLAHPEVGRALARLAGRISDRDMRAMNAAVDVGHRDVRDVAAQFLQRLPRS